MRHALFALVFTALFAAAGPVTARKLHVNPFGSPPSPCELALAPLVHLRHLVQVLQAGQTVCINIDADGDTVTHTSVRSTDGSSAPAVEKEKLTEAEQEYCEERLERLEELEEECAELEEEVREAVEEAVEEACEAMEECREEAGPRGKAFTMQMLYLDEEVLAHLRDFSDVTWTEPLDASERATFMIGGMNYHR
ncbi:MAG: hypothetical protein GF331_20995, partial [Chitinivibrionales bacterium]|nr:hypothetical protein [Chitinivibrionales bacterium]